MNPSLAPKSGNPLETTSLTGAAFNMRRRTQPGPIHAEPLEILIASGGTRVFIDSVRCITNGSTGHTGALLAQDFLRAGHKVTYLHSSNAALPFSEEMVMDPAKPREEELDRLAKAFDRYKGVEERLSNISVEDFFDYEKKIHELCRSGQYDVVIVAMAASDYGTAQSIGKISSSLDSMTLNLRPLPKIISGLRKDDPGLFLVGFKQESSGDPRDLVEAAYGNLLRDHQDIAVANLVRDGEHVAECATYLITKEKGIIPVKRFLLPDRLREITAARAKETHLRTELTTVEALPLEQTEIDEFLETEKRFSRLALFPPYLEGDERDFGFLARRTVKGALITGRGTSKRNPTAEGLAIVTDVDHGTAEIKVTSCGTKATLNANVAFKIFSLRPEINYIVHTHNVLPEAMCVQQDTSPGTVEDWEAILPPVARGEKLIGQPNHGTLILLRHTEELIPILLRNGIYSKKPELYDLAYSRFQKGTTIVDMAAEIFPKDGNILDLAAGTGEVTRLLMEKGFKNVHPVDASREMLKVAAEKLPDGPLFQVEKLENFWLENMFDGAILRQGINYVAPESLEDVFCRILKSLHPGSCFIFNSFDSEAQVPEERMTHETVGEDTVSTFEANLVEGNMIYHGQRTEIFRGDGWYEQVYDLNRFYIYPKEDFRNALRNAGFTAIQTAEIGSSIYFIARKPE